MILNLSTNERFSLMSVHRSGRGRIYAGDKQTEDSLLRQGFAERSGNGDLVITASGREACEFIRSRKEAEDKLWARALEIVATFPAGGHGSSRSAGQYIHNDEATGIAVTYTAFNEDGTDTVHSVMVVAGANGKFTEEVFSREDTCDKRWGPGGEMDNDTDAHRRIIVDHTVYYIGPDGTGPKHAKGFGGRRWDIVHLADGRTESTCNLWHASTVPPKWRERWPDTARFDHSWAEQRAAGFRKIIENASPAD